MGMRNRARPALEFETRLGGVAHLRVLTEQDARDSRRQP